VGDPLLLAVALTSAAARLRRSGPPKRRTPLARRTPLQRVGVAPPERPPLAASDAQRAKVAGQPCLVCARTVRVDPAHLVPRSLGGCDDPACVVPLCRRCHRAYDSGELDLLPWLEPRFRLELAHAVGHLGLLGALRRLTRRRDHGLAA
jgi:5-methylcytosine-specific restriction endonuclease McrA